MAICITRNVSICLPGDHALVLRRELAEETRQSILQIRRQDFPWQIMHLSTTTE